MVLCRQGSNNERLRFARQTALYPLARCPKVHAITFTPGAGGRPCLTTMDLISSTFMLRREKRHDAVASAETVDGYPSRTLVIVVADDQEVHSFLQCRWANLRMTDLTLALA
jgi:hypothetical protein